MDAAIKPGIMVEDSDDEDLEALRLAALQSIKSKPTVVAPCRRPKPIGRTKRPRNFYRGCVNTNLIAIVPTENPLDESKPAVTKVDDPPPLVLPQDRYCKTEVKTEPPEKETQVSSKFSRFEDSDSGDSDDDLDEEFDNKSSDSDQQCETADKNAIVDTVSVIEDDDELLLQDEDSLGKFFIEIEEECKETEKVKSDSANLTSRPSDRKKHGEKVEGSAEMNSNLGSRDKEPTGDKSSLRKISDNKTSILGKRAHEHSESVRSKGENLCARNHLQEGSPHKKTITASDEDSKRINRPCVTGRNRSPSPLRSRQFDRFDSSPSRSRRRNESPLKRRPSPPSPGSLSPFYKREAQCSRLSQFSAKTVQLPQSLPSRNSPRDMTPPSYWGSHSNSSHGFSQALTTREWSSSPNKWSSHAVTGSLSDPPHTQITKNISPCQVRSSKSPPRRGSKIHGSAERDWSASPPRRRCRDIDTPPDSLRCVNESNKASRRNSTSPVRAGDQPRQGNRLADASFSSRQPSPGGKGAHSPLRTRRSRSPLWSPSRTPSLSPSPEPEGKSSAGSHRRHKSPLRLPSYRPPSHRDGRTIRQDGKVNRKDNDRMRALRINGPMGKMLDSKLEIPKMRSYNSKPETKCSEPTPEEKVDTNVKESVQARSPIGAPPPNSWSSDEGVESDSESRFKGADNTRGPQVTVSPPKQAPVTFMKVGELEEPTPSEKKSPKRKKNKRSKKAFPKSKGKDDSPDEPKAKRMNDVDLRAELSRRRAERVNKAKSNNQSVPLRLVQSAFQSLTSKSNSMDGERSVLKSFATKSEVGTELLISKKKPIHLRLGLPVARNPDPPEVPVSANSALPKISGFEKTDGCDPIIEGGNKWRKVKLKRSVTVQKSLPRGTPTNTSGKEQV